MKKILYITTLSRTINAFLVPHIEMLIKEGHKVDCACNIDHDLNKVIENKCENIYNLPFSRNPLDPKNLKAYKMLLDIQKKNNYDIVHVHTQIAAIYGRLLKLKFPNIKDNSSKYAHYTTYPCYIAHDFLLFSKLFF